MDDGWGVGEDLVEEFFLLVGEGSSLPEFGDGRFYLRDISGAHGGDGLLEALAIAGVIEGEVAEEDGGHEVIFDGLEGGLLAGGEIEIGKFAKMVEEGLVLTIGEGGKGFIQQIPGIRLSGGEGFGELILGEVEGKTGEFAIPGDFAVGSGFLGIGLLGILFLFPGQIAEGKGVEVDGGAENQESGDLVEFHRGKM